MAKSVVNVTQARDNLAEILGRVKSGNEVVVVEKKGKPYAVIISPVKYEAFQKAAKEKLFTIIDTFRSRNTNYTDDEIMKDVTEVVEDVRQNSGKRGIIRKK